jgi:hypothetical protein
VLTEILSSQVDEEVAIPRIIRGDVKEMFIGKVRIDGCTGCVRGKVCDKFGENEGLLTLGCQELEVVFLKDNDPTSEFSVNLATAEQILHKVGISYDLGGAKQNVMAQFLDCEDNCKSEFLFMFVF